MVIDQNHPLARHAVNRKNSLRKAPKIAQELAKTVDYWGAKCEDYEPDCPACKAWKLFETTLVCPSDADIHTSSL
jgi:hypothetical protein